MQLFLLPYPHGAVGRAPWKTLSRNTLALFLSKMSGFSVSVVMPHQLSANLTRIGHVTHELQPYKNVVETARFIRASSQCYKRTSALQINSRKCLRSPDHCVRLYASLVSASLQKPLKRWFFRISLVPFGENYRLKT